MDLRTLYEPQDDFKAWAKAKKTVKLIRSMPATVNLREDGKLLVRATTENDAEVTEAEYDMVILSVGMRPEGAASELASSLGIKADSHGFASSSPDLEKEGVFVVGAVSGPMDIEETSVRAVAAAERIPHDKEVQG